MQCVTVIAAVTVGDIVRDSEYDRDVSGLKEEDEQPDDDRDGVAVIVSTSEAEEEPLAHMVENDEDDTVPDALEETDELDEGEDELDGHGEYETPPDRVSEELMDAAVVCEGETLLLATVDELSETVAVAESEADGDVEMTGEAEKHADTDGHPVAV